MKRAALTILILWTIIPACDHANEPQPSISFERWKALGLADYSVDQRRSCFCLEGGSVMRLSVRGDSVTRVVRLSDSTEIFPPIARLYMTIDSLFGVIRARQYDSIVVRYNPEYGYPEFLDIDPQLHPVDGGALYETANVRPTPSSQTFRRTNFSAKVFKE
jgi:hypothetical protein